MIPLSTLKIKIIFSGWAYIDAGMKNSYVGVNGTVGFVSAWDCKNKDAGVGRRTGGFTVTWKFHGIMKYPLNIMMLFINFEKEIGDDLQGGLTKLKQIIK